MKSFEELEALMPAGNISAGEPIRTTFERFKVLYCGLKEAYEELYDLHKLLSEKK